MKRSLFLYISCAMIVAAAAAAVVFSDVKREDKKAAAICSGKIRCAVLINNDPADRHRANIKAAVSALKACGFNRLVVFGAEKVKPSAKEIFRGLKELQSEGVKIELLYITGHGSLLYSKENPDGLASVMFRDRPVIAKQFSPWINHGKGVVYLDQCFAPQFMEELAAGLDGEYLLLSDKHEEHPNTSCRNISTKFWKYMDDHAEEDSFFALCHEAWKLSCPRGSDIMVGDLFDAGEELTS